MANPSILVFRLSGVAVGAESGIQSSSPKPHGCILGPQGSLRCAPRPSGWGSSTPSRGRSVSIRCKAASGGEAPPESREEAILQAAGSVAALLEKTLKRRGPTTVKQRKQQRQVRLRVEIPVLDDTPSSLASLTLDFLSTLFPASRAPPGVAVFFSDPLALEDQTLANPNTSFHSLPSETDVSGDVAVVVVAGATFDDISRLQELARNVNPTPVVVLNPVWSPEDDTHATWGGFVTSFEPAYAFLPLSIQGFFSKTEGAVLKNVQSGAPGGAPWHIFVKQDGKFSRLSSLKRRPGPADLESALYNAMAANSPVTKSIKFLRGLVSKD